RLPAGGSAVARDGGDPGAARPGLDDSRNLAQLFRRRGVQREYVLAAAGCIRRGARRVCGFDADELSGDRRISVARNRPHRRSARLWTGNVDRVDRAAGRLRRALDQRISEMKQRLKRWIFGLLGKDPEAVVVTFATGDPELCRRMAEEVRSLEP